MNTKQCNGCGEEFPETELVEDRFVLCTSCDDKYTDAMECGEEDDVEDLKMGGHPWASFDGEDQ